MPFFWKIVNALFVFIPKLFIWRKTMTVGVTFLLETSSIADLVANTMGLTFVLGMDELICTILMSPRTRYIIFHVEPYPLFSTTEGEDETNRESFDRNARDRNWSLRSWDLYMQLIPH